LKIKMEKKLIIRFLEAIKVCSYIRNSPNAKLIKLNNKFAMIYFSEVVFILLMLIVLYYLFNIWVALIVLGLTILIVNPVVSEIKYQLKTETKKRNIKLKK